MGSSKGWTTLAERWFFALWPDEATRAALAAPLAGWLPKGARPLDPRDLHLTLAFLGPVAPEVMPCIERIATRIQAAPFALRIDRIGHFRGARVLWCGPTETPPALETLVADLRDGLATCGLALDPRPYRPHVTLARHVAVAPRVSWPAAVTWRADAFVLAAGGGAPTGRRYRIARRWDLVTHPSGPAMPTTPSPSSVA